MKLQHLKYIVEIADCRSITKASRKLFVSQPYLSKIIADAEAKLKRQIFIRSNQGLELTPYGHKVYHLARSVIRQMELLEHLEMENTEIEKAAELSISVANLIIKESLLLDYFALGRANRYELELHETTIQKSIENVEKEISEFAVVVIDDHQKSLLESMLGTRYLEYKEWDEGQLYYHLHKNHPLARQTKIPIDSLTMYPFVRLKMDDFAICSSEKFKEEYPDVRVNQSIVVNHYHSYLSIVKNNGAFMIGNKWQISELEKMGILSVQFSSSKHKVHLGMIKKKGWELSEEAQIFLHLVKESYGVEEV